MECVVDNRSAFGDSLMLEARLGMARQQAEALSWAVGRRLADSDLSASEPQEMATAEARRAIHPAGSPAPTSAVARATVGPSSQRQEEVAAVQALQSLGPYSAD